MERGLVSLVLSGGKWLGEGCVSVNVLCDMALTY
jgi:hypothetical protein